MYKNFLKIAFRNLLRYKAYTLINLTGLAIGLASVILILAFVRGELSYDRFHEKADRIYRLNFVRTQPELSKMAAVGPPTGPAMKAEFPEIENYVRFRPTDRQLIRVGDESFYEDDLFYVDSTFFQVFSFPLLQGNPYAALKSPNQVVISEELAQKYFADQNPIGQSIQLEDGIPLKVSGVMAPIPTLSHLRPRMLVSFSTFTVPEGYPVTLESWGWTSFPTYFLLADNQAPGLLQEKLSENFRARFQSERAQSFGLELQALTDIYLHSSEIRERQDIAASGDARYTYGLSAVAVLILLIACFNFMNLATARSARRSLEVGVRKVLGASRKQLISQFLGESLLLSLLSLLLALFLIELFTDALLPLLGIEFEVAIGNYWLMLPLSFGMALLVGIMAGVYPAMFLSSIPAISAMRNKVLNSKRNRISFRQLLVVFQFVISICLIATTGIVQQQMNYISNRDLGYNSDQVLALDLNGEVLQERYELLKQQLSQNPNVVHISAGGEKFDGDQGSVPIVERNRTDAEAHPIAIYGVYYGFFETFNFEVLKGRAHDPDIQGDSTAFILNESAVKMFGWKDDPIGKDLTLNNVWEGEVIGVVKDFHFSSLHTEISPLVMMIPRTRFEQIYVKIRRGDYQDILASLEADWAEIVPEYPFQHTFIDDRIDRLYRADRRFAGLITGFSFLAIFIACLGLYGLIAYLTENRSKEIGIRKVLGASGLNIVMLLSRQFAIALMAAAVVAWPLSWWLMNHWLEDFAYRIEIGFGGMIIAALVVGVIAWLTVSGQSLRAARTNPADVLRSE